MKRMLLMAAAAGVLAVAAWAGGEHARCAGGTQECLDYMAASLQNRGWMGVELAAQADGTMIVKQVVEGGPAQGAGLAVGDAIVAIDGIRLGDVSQQEALRRIQADMLPGTTVSYSLVRDKQARSVQIKLAPMPDSVRFQIIGAHMLEHAKPIAPASKS